MHKTPYVFPIVGGRKIEHLRANIEALNLVLSEEDMEAIEAAAPFDIGWPGNMIGTDAGSSLMPMASHFKFVEGPKPIAPHKA